MTLEDRAAVVEHRITIGEAKLVLQEVNVPEEHPTTAHALNVKLLPQRHLVGVAHASFVFDLFVTEKGIAAVAPYGKHFLFLVRGVSTIRCVCVYA